MLYLFLSSKSAAVQVDPNNLRHLFRRIVGKLGVEHLRFHDLRHTHATLLLARGIHPKIVNERLGHASIAITLDTYSHVLPNLQEEAAAQLDDLLEGLASDECQQTVSKC